MTIKVNYEPTEDRLGVGIATERLITLHCEDYLY